ncbi:MAG: TIGR00341 family protein [Spirochaetia bacterium]|nr:TIGR00341 family protein [Spirochaetia bacterium]
MQKKANEKNSKNVSQKSELTEKSLMKKVVNIFNNDTTEKSKDEEEKNEWLPDFYKYYKNNWRPKEDTGFFSKFKNLYSSYQSLKEKEIAKLNVYESISRSAQLSREFLVLLFGSCLIAVFGLFQNSTAVIIGAMLIAPLMMPILGFALGAIWGDKKLIWRSFYTLFSGSLMVLAISSALTYYIPGIELNSEIMARTNPNLFDIFVALASGLVGAYAYVHPNISSSISGVAIAVALMPPLCTAGIGIGLENQKIAIGALLLYMTNLVGISFSASIVFWRLKVHPITESSDQVTERAARKVIITLILLILLAVPLGYFMIETYQLKKKQVIVNNLIKEIIPQSEVEKVEIMKYSDHFMIKAIIMTNKKIDIETSQEIYNKIKSLFTMPVNIKIGTLLTIDNQ